MKKILVSLSTFAAVFALSSLALAADAAKAAPANWGVALSAALAIAVAAFGGAIAQGRAAAAALEGIARNPEAQGKIQGPMILSLALIESLVIFALVVAFLLYGKV